MGDLIVKPAYKFGPKDILDADKLNLLATPVVELALTDPVNDQNFFRNGNFYSSFWTTPAGLTCPAGLWTTNASYWLCRPDTTAPFTTLTAAFVQPAVNATVSVTVGATAWMSPTQAIYIIGGGNYTVSSVTDATHAVVKNLGSSGNAAPGVNVPSGAYLSPSAAAVTFLRSSQVPDQFSLFTAELQGASSVAAVEFGQQINGDLSATLRRKCTFSGYFYNVTGLTLSPTLNIYTCDAFNNFSAITLRTSVNLQTGATLAWTYSTATIDLSLLTNVANGLLIAIVLPAGSLDQPAKNVLFSRLKFQIGEVATQFVDDPSLFVQAPSVDSTMLQDGCIARPTLFLPNVVPTGAYQAKSINNGDINDGAINGRTLAAGAAVGNLGYTPVNKAGDTGLGYLYHTVDTAVGAPFVSPLAVGVNMTSGNASNTGYYPAIGFNRPGIAAKTLGLSTNRRFLTIDDQNQSGYLLDTITKVDTNSYQDGSITLQKLATSLVNLLIAPGIIQAFAGPSPPTGWLICDGTSYLTSSYPALFAAIGTYWGNGGDVSGAHFQVPDFQGRAPIGYVNKGAPGITVRTFGLRGGNETHTLSVAEMPSHAHGVNDGQHTHTGVAHHHSYVNPLGSAMSTYAGGQTTYQPGGTTNTSDEVASMLPASANISIQNNGGNAPHDIMQPFGVLYFIIKY
jgi:microcystin-dependent protein